MKAAEKAIIIRMLNRFRQASIGDIVSHDELIKLNSGSRYRHYWAASRAMRLLNEENGAVFATVNREGYRRLNTGDGAAYAGDRSRNRIHKEAGRGFKRLQNVARRSNDVSPDQLRKINQHLSAFGLISHLTQKRSVEAMPISEPAKADDMQGLKQALGIS